MLGREDYLWYQLYWYQLKYILPTVFPSLCINPFANVIPILQTPPQHKIAGDSLNSSAVKYSRQIQSNALANKSQLKNILPKFQG